MHTRFGTYLTTCLEVGYLHFGDLCYILKGVTDRDLVPSTKPEMNKQVNESVISNFLGFGTCRERWLHGLRLSAAFWTDVS
jgi:hypothetical protein